MTPVIKHLPLEDAPLIDHASGIRNADRQRAAGILPADHHVMVFLFGLLAGALLATGLTLCIVHP